MKTVSVTLLAAAFGLPETVEENMVIEKLTERLKASETQQSVPGEIITTLSARTEALEKKVMGQESAQADEREWFHRKSGRS